MRPRTPNKKSGGIKIRWSKKKNLGVSIFFEKISDFVKKIRKKNLGVEKKYEKKIGGIKFFFEKTPDFVKKIGGPKKKSGVSIFSYVLLAWVSLVEIPQELKKMPLLD